MVETSITRHGKISLTYQGKNIFGVKESITLELMDLVAR